jgi:hypothetical protein
MWQKFLSWPLILSTMARVAERQIVRQGHDHIAHILAQCGDEKERNYSLAKASNAGLMYHSRSLAPMK